MAYFLQNGLYYTPKQAADILGTDLLEVNRLVREGKFPAKSVDRHRWIPAKPFEAFVRRRRDDRSLAGAPAPGPIGVRKGEHREVLGPPDDTEGGAHARADSPYYTDEEAADRLGVGSDDVRYLAFVGKLEKAAVDGRRVYPKESVEALLTERNGSKTPKKATPRAAEERGQAPLTVGVRAKGSQVAGRSKSRSPEASAPTADYYTPFQAAEILGKSSAAVYRMIERGKLPAVRLDARRYRWIPADVVIPATAVRRLMPGGSSGRQRANRSRALDPYRLVGPVGPGQADQNPGPRAPDAPGDPSGRAAPQTSPNEKPSGRVQPPADPSETPARGLAGAEDGHGQPDNDREAPGKVRANAPAVRPGLSSTRGRGKGYRQPGMRPQVVKELHGLSKRTKNCLLRAGIATVPELRRRGRDELMAIPNFGAMCLREVENLLAERGTSLAYGRKTTPNGDRTSSLDRERSPLDLPIHESFAYHILSTRTRTRLDVAGVWSVDDLRRKTAAYLLKVDGFGAKCLNEVEVFLEAHGCVLGETGPEHEAPGPPLPGSFERPEGFEGLLSLLATYRPARRRLERSAKPDIDSALDTIESCWSKAERQVAQGILDDRALLECPPMEYLAHLVTPKARTLPDLLFRLQYLVCEGVKVRHDALRALDESLDASTLDAEMALLLGAFDERTLHVLKQRFGAEPKTLREIGQELRVSHERVRQLQADAVGRLKRDHARLALPRTRTAMAKAAAEPAASREHVVRMLRASGLARDDSAAEDFLIAWRAIRPTSYPFPEGMPPSAAKGLDRRQRKLSGQIAAIARRQLRTRGAAALAEIPTVLEGRRCAEQEVAAVLRKIGLREIGLGYWGAARESYPIHNAAEKMIKACGPLTVEHIRIGALRHQQRRGHTVPSSDVLLAALAAHEAFYVADGDVVHLHDLTRGIWPNPAEHAWLGAVAASGPVVHATTMYRALDDHGVNSGLMDYLTKYSELVQPLGEGLYCLPGARYADGDLEAGRKQASNRWKARYGPNR